ncbi:hypothetical protein [Bauldia sp.]|uniref:hypothetical protein n=1 Tax=Bauldia sp. TaxID=2575872 RepID=UPI003BA8C438
MSERLHTIEAENVRLVLDLEVGHVRSFETVFGERTIEPLHTAPWIEEKEIIEADDIPGNLKYLSGDFFCAPFAASDVEGGPAHGWPANSPWSLIDHRTLPDGATASFGLDKPVMGARLIKEIRLRDGHPFAYQRHIFEGGRGAVSVASHAMTRFAEPGRLSFSSKAFAETPEMVQEPDPERGRSLFATSARVEDLSKLPLADGTTVDLRRYPVAEGHEDFVMLVEAGDSPLGWTAAVRSGVGDVFLSLKNPSDFPVTFLWFSNGGRFYPPWNSRHLGVLGVEEGRAYSAYGHKASIEPNPLSEGGIPTALTLDPDGSVSVAHVIGGIPLPEGADEVFDIEAAPGVLRVTLNDGRTLEYLFDPTFLHVG